MQTKIPQFQSAYWTVDGAPYGSILYWEIWQLWFIYIYIYIYLSFSLQESPAVKNNKRCRTSVGLLSITALNICPFSAWSIERNAQVKWWQHEQRFTQTKTPEMKLKYNVRKMFSGKRKSDIRKTRQKNKNKTKPRTMSQSYWQRKRYDTQKPRWDPNIECVL